MMSKKHLGDQISSESAKCSICTSPDREVKRLLRLGKNDEVGSQLVLGEVAGKFGIRRAMGWDDVLSSAVMPESEYKV